MLHLCFEKSIFIVMIDFFNIFILMIDFCCCWYYQLLWGHDKDRPVISDRTHPSGFDRGPDYWSWLLITAPLKPCKLNAAKPGVTVATNPGDPQDCLLLVGNPDDWCLQTDKMYEFLPWMLHRWLMFHFLVSPVSREPVYRSERQDLVKGEESNLGWARKVVQSL